MPLLVDHAASVLGMYHGGVEEGIRSAGPGRGLTAGVSSLGEDSES